MTVQRELQAPPSLGHPTRTGQARPMRAPRLEAAPLQPEASPNRALLAWLERLAPAASRASAGPMTELAGSTKSPAERRAWRARRLAAIPKPVQAPPREGRLEGPSGPAALPTTARGQRARPRKARPLEVQAQAAAKRRAQDLPSSEPARQVRLAIPTLRPVSGRNSPPARQVPRASPRSELEQPKRRRSHPTKGTWPPRA